MNRGARPTTATVVAMLTLNRDCGELSVEWARDLIASGFESQPLLRLAAAEPPFNFFEIRTRIDRVIEDLQIGALSQTEAIQVLGANILRRGMAIDRDLPTVVDAVHALCVEEDYASELIQFCHLWWAWETLRDHGDQHYVEAADDVEIWNLMRIEVQALLATADQLEARVVPIPGDGRADRP